MRKSDFKLAAAKCIPLEAYNHEDSEFLKTYLQREVSFLMNLSCNYIMQLEDICFISSATSAVKQEHLVIIGELAQENLDDFITKYKGPIPEEIIMKLFTQILLGMNFLHRNNIDHRDIKPMNILLFNNGEVAKLADFGLARNIKSEFSKLTEGLGTYKYMAPEAQRGSPVPYKSDMYSLGILLHIMLTKTLPKYDDVKTGKFATPEGYSKDIIELLSRLLKKKPEKRPTVKQLFQLDYVLMAVEKLQKVDCQCSSYA